MESVCKEGAWEEDEDDEEVDASKETEGTTTGFQILRERNELFRWDCGCGCCCFELDEKETEDTEGEGWKDCALNKDDGTDEDTKDDEEVRELLSLDQLTSLTCPLLLSFSAFLSAMIVVHAPSLALPAASCRAFIFSSVSKPS